MKLYRYKNFIKESNENYIDSICRKYLIRSYTINDDLSIDVDGDIYLEYHSLTKLPLNFRNVSGDFSCRNNQLTSLEGGPNKVGGCFNCNNNKLTSLLGAPREVGNGFYCSGNKLTSLEGISQYISGVINVRLNQLIDVRGVKDGWRGQFLMGGNPVQKIFKLFPKERWDEVIEYLNEHEVIRDGKVVVLAALELVFYDMGLEVPDIDEIEEYQIQY